MHSEKFSLSERVVESLVWIKIEVLVLNIRLTGYYNSLK